MEKNIAIAIIVLLLFWLANLVWIGFVLALLILFIPLSKPKKEKGVKKPKVEPIIVEKEYEGTIYPEKIKLVYGKPEKIKPSLKDTLKSLGKVVGVGIRKLIKGD